MIIHPSYCSRNTSKPTTTSKLTQNIKLKTNKKNNQKDNNKTTTREQEHGPRPSESNKRMSDTPRHRHTSSSRTSHGTGRSFLYLYVHCIECNRILPPRPSAVLKQLDPYSYSLIPTYQHGFHVHTHAMLFPCQTTDRPTTNKIEKYKNRNEVQTNAHDIRRHVSSKITIKTNSLLNCLVLLIRIVYRLSLLTT